MNEEKVKGPTKLCGEKRQHANSEVLIGITAILFLQVAK
jgi:hypothetical protein